jgi:hypothetical protein
MLFPLLKNIPFVFDLNSDFTEIFPVCYVFDELKIPSHVSAKRRT